MLVPDAKEGPKTRRGRFGRHLSGSGIAPGRRRWPDRSLTNVAGWVDVIAGNDKMVSNNEAVDDKRQGEREDQVRTGEGK